MTQTEIRHYQHTDFEQVALLWNKLGLGGAERGDDEKVIEHTLKHGAAFFVMLHSGKIIGTAWITNDFRRLYLHHMGVDPAFQNQGLGYELLKNCIQWSMEVGLQLKLEVNPANKAAVYLYKKAGFKRLGDYDVFIIRDYKKLPEDLSGPEIIN